MRNKVLKEKLSFLVTSWMHFTEYLNTHSLLNWASNKSKTLNLKLSNTLHGEFKFWAYHFSKMGNYKSLSLIHVATWSIAYQSTGLSHANRACTQTIDLLLRRSSSSHVEIKTAGEFIVFKRKGLGVEVGKGGNRCALSKRKGLWIKQHPTP